MLILLAAVMGAMLFQTVPLAVPKAAPQEDTGLYEIRQYGARGDGRTRDTAAVQAAMDAAAQHGGGTVRFAPGRYLCGTLHLHSHLTLHLDSGAMLLISRDKAELDPVEKLSYDSHADVETTDFHFALLAGQDVEDIAIEGHGVIDGNRTARGGPKPIALKNCRGVTIRDVTVQNSPSYSVSLLGCEQVHIEGVTVLNSYADGIDLDCCRLARIANCSVDSHDDALCLKSSPALGSPHPTDYVTVTNCLLRTDCNYFKMGTESSGAFRRIALSNCTMSRRANAQVKDRDLGGIAIESVDGAKVDGIVVSNVTMEDVVCPIFIRLGNRGRGLHPPIPGSLQNVSITNVVAVGARLPCCIAGIAGYAIRDVTLSDIRLTVRDDGLRRLGLDVPEAANAYPDPDMFGPLPATGLYCRHVSGLSVRNLQVQREVIDPRPFVIADDIEGFSLDGLRTDSLPPPEYLIWLNQARGAEIRAIHVASLATTRLLHITGASSNVLHRD